MSEKDSTAGGPLPELANQVLEALSPGRGVVVCGDAQNMARAVRYATAICLDRRDKAEVSKTGKVSEIMAKASVPEWLHDFMESLAEAGARVIAAEPALTLAVGMLGTHGGKVPDNRLELGAMMPPRDILAASSGAAGVHGGSVRLSHPLSGSRNAAQNAQMRFLCMGVSWEGGAPISLAAILAEDCEAREAILAEFSEEAREVLLRVGTACARRLAGAVPQSVGGYRAQVLFPVDGGYVALAPLYSYGIGAEIIARVGARRWAAEGQRQIIETRVAHVGGTKPQNTGLLATYAAGKFLRLVGRPQPNTAFGGKATVRILQDGRLRPVGGSVAKDSFDEFHTAAVLQDAKPNVEQTARLEAAFRRMAEDVLESLRLVAEENEQSLASTGAPLSPGKGAAGPSRDIALILGLVEADDGDAAMQRVAEAAARRVARSLSGRKIRTMSGPKTIVVDEALHDRLVAAARQVIEECV